MKRLPILILPLLLIALSSHAQRYRGYDDYTKFRVGVQGGWSYRLNKISPSVPADFRSYVKGLKTGYNYGANAAFFFSESLGAGIEYSGFRTKNEMEVSVMDATTYKIYKGTMSDDISIGFIGPSFLLRGITGRNDNIHILGKFALGYVSYKDEFAVIGMNATNTAGTVGAELAVCFDVALQKNVFVGAQGSYMGATLKGIDIEDAAGSRHMELPKDEYEGLSRIDLSAGLRINF